MRCRRSYPGPPFRQEIEACFAVERVRWTNADLGCRMNQFVKLLCAAVLFGMAQGPARSQDGPCKVADYLLTASGPHWRDTPFGRHAPGFLLCESCSSGPTASGGLYHFFSDRVPATAAERAERRKERVSYPYIGLGPENLEHLGSREGITLGPLTGYAVLFRITAKPSWATSDLKGSEGVLVIALTDGCASFETTILLGSSGGRDPWISLDSLLTEVTIEKTRGARAAPPPTAQRIGDP